MARLAIQKSFKNLFYKHESGLLKFAFCIYVDFMSFEIDIGHLHHFFFVTKGKTECSWKCQVVQPDKNEKY